MSGNLCAAGCGLDRLHSNAECLDRRGLPAALSPRAGDVPRLRAENQSLREALTSALDDAETRGKVRGILDAADLADQEAWAEAWRYVEAQDQTGKSKSEHWWRCVALTDHAGALRVLTAIELEGRP